MANLSLTNGLRRLAQKDYAAVHAEAIDLIKQDVNSALPFFLLGVVAFDHKNYGKALELFEKAERLDPSEPHFTAYRAMTLSILRRSNEARLAADSISSSVHEYPHLSDMVGVVYSRCGFHEKAITQFKAATSRNTSEPNYFFNLAASQQFLGKFDAAQTAYQKTIELEPLNYRAWSSLISLRKQSEDENYLPQLLKLAAAKDLQADAKLHLGHAIAKTLEDLGQHKESLEWLLKAKESKRSQFPFDRQSASETFDAAQNTASRLSGTAIFTQITTPIFIVGLPRTGTTLVDRMLSSHSLVTSAGELNAFAEQVKNASGTDTPFVLDAPTLAATCNTNLELVGKAYLQSTEALAQGAPFMVDKMPLNFFYAALMTKAFSNVKIIALRRGAMDSCLSNFRQLFSTQFSYYNYTFDLEDTAFFYRKFDALMAHWRTSLSSQNFMEVAYEDIVFDQENQTRRLLEFCGLPWEEACMRFYENKAAVSTASSVQVRRPLYSGSIGRWKKYGNNLDGLRKALGELAD